MIYKLITLTGKSFIISKPLEVELKADKDAPAHSLYLSFVAVDNKSKLFNSVEDEVTKVYICYNDGKVLMEMLVDEQQVCCSSAGIIFKIYARSRAALLLDNEAMPQEYTAPSLELVIKNHAKPFGFTAYKGKNKVCYNSFTIPKGLSQWKVLESFSESFSYKQPKITFDNIIDFDYSPVHSNISFSNKYKDINIVNYESITYTYKRQEKISKVMMKCEKGGSYDKAVINDEAVKKGIIRQRYINMVDTLNAEYKIKKLINEASNEAINISLLCSGAVFVEPLDYISIDDNLMKGLTGLKVAALHYKLNSKGEKTFIKLFKAG